ncbi:MAG: N-6 DNA methylase [Patescibacteria group bacterium]|jgi:type I restriction enzyme M protein
MNTDTKRHIDSARQVLVGVVPNPTSQIDQITNALIYKFMDDMDQSAIKAGGEASFFIGELERYAWTRIMDSRIGNQDRMNLYSEALLKFSEAKQLPELFRGIFKSAFLPYRSPEVLGLFLKEIDYFDYSHPEELGNAYEYLLSVMSSQGDAGQFRTPRHIIDFIVDVVNPTKDDKVLDPACGTGGFLVSSYIHILEQHDQKNDPNKKEKPLTPDERKKLMNNFEGYDIDPGMVRIAQVNMYLHQFKNPKIFQYDTLSMEERWNDKFDVVMANPPFMSPHGGVQTHNKFSIKSSRSEVLFVDYIMNHLRPKGRAGIIVPEGIIFQSGTAHKLLRKNLINDGLYAVVSLPSGVFQPYSGVKTSILLFNNELAKQSKEILFIKVENDGFDLGATKRPIIKNDLPEALSILNSWNVGKKVENKLSVYVEKSRIAENGNYNLSGDRYRVVTDYSNAKWPMVELEEYCEILNGYAFKSEEYSDKGIRVIRITNVQKGLIVDDNPKFYPEDSRKEIKQYMLEKNDLLVSLTGNVGRVGLLPSELLPAALNQRVGCIRTLREKVIKNYLFHILNTEFFENECIKSSSGVAQKNLSTEWLKKYKIPFPPLEIQIQIIEELDGNQKIIDGARQIVKNWKPRIYTDPKWWKVKLEDVCEINPKKSEIKNLNTNMEVSFVPMSDLNQKNLYFQVLKTKKVSEVMGSYTYFSDNDVLLARVTPCFENGKAGIAKNLKNKIGFGSSEYIILRPTKKILPEIIYTNIIDNNFNLKGKAQMTGTGGLQRVPVVFVENWIISLPPLEIQKQIVEKIEAERAMVESAKKLIEIYEQKIKDVIAKLWGE